MTSTSTPVQVVTTYFTALAEGRVPDALGCLDPQVEWHQPGDNQFSGVHQGPEAVAELIGAMMTVSEGTFAVAPTGRLMSNGAVVAAPVRFTGERAGARLDQDGMDLLTVADGRIVAVHLFSSDGPAEDAFWGSADPAGSAGSSGSTPADS